MSSTLSCVVPGCTRTRSTMLQADLDLKLCDRDLAALRRMCMRKHRIGYAKAATREAERLRAIKDAPQTGPKAPAPYTCFLCDQWHVGHAESVPVARPAVLAAAAVRSHLTAEQLNQLVKAWRPLPRVARPLNTPVGTRPAGAH
jgi:hypothetical protein